MVFANPITHDNQQATMMNLVDISVQQRLEERIQLDNERRRGIIITVAHELRTPLQPILGYLNLLIQDPEGFGILDETKKMLERCLVSVDRERQIINQMLELSVLESGKIQLTFSEFPLSPLVHSVLDTSGYISKAEVTLDIPDRPGHRVRTGTGCIPCSIPSSPMRSTIPSPRGRSISRTAREPGAPPI